MFNSLSLVVIFKDEYQYLRPCVESVLPVVDECILVDSGSSDGSERLVFEMQRAFPKKQIHYFFREWPGDFADQKNFALSRATGDWILLLDADEQILSRDHLKLLSALKRDEVDAYLLPIWNFTRDFREIGFQKPFPEKEGFIVTQLHRLFRNRKNFAYSGMLHEKIEPSLFEQKARTASLDVPIQHYGKLKEKDLQLESARYEFYEKLARKKVNQFSSDAQSHWELGVILQKQKKLVEAEKEFLSAYHMNSDIEDFEVSLFLCQFQQSRWATLKESQPRFRKSLFFKIFAAARTDLSVWPQLEEFYSDFPQTPLLLFELALPTDDAFLIEKYRADASPLFAATGWIEFLEGAYFRKRDLFERALPLLQGALARGCLEAIHEILICYGKLKAFAAGQEFIRELKDKNTLHLKPETLTVISYIEQGSRH